MKDSLGCGLIKKRSMRNKDGHPRFPDPDLNAIAEKLGLWRLEMEPEGWLTLYFHEYFNVKSAIAALERVGGVVKAVPGEWEVADDQPDLAGAPADDGTFAVVVRGRYNKRTYKYTGRGFRFFLVSDAELTEVASQEASRSPYFRSVVAERGWHLKLRWPLVQDN